MIEKLKVLLKGWRTALFGVAVTAVGTWDACASAGVDITPLFSEQTRPVAMSLIGIAVVTLRYLTTTEIGKK